MKLFVYGTLMDNALVVQLTGRRFPRRPAVLAGYRKHMPAAGYPYILRDEASTVEGVVLEDIDAAALQAFDQYEDEGCLYARVEVTISVGGELCGAFAYAALGTTQISGRRS